MSQANDKGLNESQLNVKFNVIPKTKLDPFQQHFASFKNGLVTSDPGNLVVTPLYSENAEKIYRMEPREDDVWIVTYPKCGKRIYHFFKHLTYSNVEIRSKVQLGRLNWRGC